MNRLKQTSLALIAAAFAACNLTPSQPEQWVSTLASAPSDSVLWEVALYTIEEQEFPIGTGADPAKLEATSGWRNSLAPFKGEGYRERAKLRLERVEAGEYRIFVQVERETNEDIAQPMDLRRAKWEEAPDNVDAARVIISKIQARIGKPLDVGEPKEKRFEGTKP